MSSSARGRGGKFSKPKRGGGKHFSRDLQPVNADGEVISMWADDRNAVKEESEDDDEESSEESSEDDDDQEQPQTREQRKALAKARKEAAIAKQKAAAKAAAPGDLPPSDSEDEDEEDEMPANPNHTSKARQQLSVVPGEPAAKKPVGELSRREREALQAQQARERYQKLHAEGKTDEARADLERLRIVREQREAAAARKKAEAEEKAEAEKAKKEQLERERKQREAALGPGASKKGARGGKKK